MNNADLKLWQEFRTNDLSDQCESMVPTRTEIVTLRQRIGSQTNNGHGIA